VANHSSVTGTLLGARHCRQLEECLDSSEVNMTEELREQISSLSRTPPLATDRNEEVTASRYENITAKK
jgi:aryl-alcohol dehydrogenase-like predicted oxidoreductase